MLMTMRRTLPSNNDGRPGGRACRVDRPIRRARRLLHACRCSTITVPPRPERSAAIISRRCPLALGRRMMLPPLGTGSGSHHAVRRNDPCAARFGLDRWTDDGLIAHGRVHARLCFRDPSRCAWRPVVHCIYAGLAPAGRRETVRVWPGLWLYRRSIARDGQAGRVAGMQCRLCILSVVYALVRWRWRGVLVPLFGWNLRTRASAVNSAIGGIA